MADDDSASSGLIMAGGAVAVLGAILGVPLLLVLGLSGLDGLDVAVTSTKPTLNTAAVPSEYLPMVQQAGTRCEAISSTVIAAQIEAESSWAPAAESKAGAMGIAQFMPATWAEWGSDYDGDGTADVLNAADAIGSQADYMCYLASWAGEQVALGIIEGNLLDLALAAYNAGMQTVVDAGGVPDIRATQDYLQKIALGISKFSGPAGGVTVPGTGVGNSSIVENAKTYLGTPYVWGGGSALGPTKGGFDCSGLTSYAVFQATGITLPRVANDQARYFVGVEVARDYSAMLPGDIIAFSKNSGLHYHHVGIYMGDGMMIHAPAPGKTVEITSLKGNSYYENFYWNIRRYS